MKNPIVSEWQDKGELETQCPYMQRFALPLRPTRIPLISKYSPEITLRYSIGRQNESYPERFDTYISFSCGGERETRRGIENRSDFHVDLHRMRDSKGTRYIVTVSGRHLEHNYGDVIDEFDPDSKGYSQGLRRVLPIFETAKKYVYEIPGIPNQGREAIELLNEKFLEHTSELSNKCKGEKKLRDIAQKYSFSTEPLDKVIKLNDPKVEAKGHLLIAQAFGATGNKMESRELAIKHGFSISELESQLEKEVQEK